MSVVMLTSWLICDSDGLGILSLSAAILLRAVLSNTTTQSEWRVSLLRVRMELYGWTTTSLISFYTGPIE